MKTMQSVLTLAVAAGFSLSAVADPLGGSSSSHVTAGESSAFPFGAGKAGLAFKDGLFTSASINLQDGPVMRIRNKHNATPINGTNPNANVNGTLNPKYLTGADVPLPLPNSTQIGQIWYEKRAHNTEVYSVRQMVTLPNLPLVPRFDGLVIGKVPGLAADQNVFFGEWAPKKGGTAAQNSTDLNMGSNKRTVWYVGDNPTEHMPNLVNAKYDVVGINKHTPGKNDFYTGVLTANYGTNVNNNKLSGNLVRGSDSISFANTTIANNGTFKNSANTISGRFYNNAQAIAGIVDRAGVANDIAFGGKKR